MLSTIILNWNRVELLRRCVDSYLATVGRDYELAIVDNASTDGSADYLRGLEAAHPVRVIYLPENIGGEALNIAAAMSRGELVQFSENDQVFLPGWRQHAEEAFAAFPDLGALSLFSDTPTDEEAWEPKPSRLRFSRGKILYEAPNNIGTSSILRGKILRENGVRVTNVEHIRLKLPDDGKLSRDVRAAGYWCGFSDRYYVRNVGHEPQEFDRDPAYYEENYANKPLTGVDGWRARIEKQAARPKPRRQSLAFPEREPVPERTPQAVNGTPARLWSMYDSRSAESETLDLVLALTRLVKPSHVIETGTWIGLSSCAIARGLVANGFGDLTTLESDPEIHRAARANIERSGLGGVVDARLCSSLEFTPDRVYDMAVFDSEGPPRLDEFRRLKPWLKPGATVIFHDTAPHCQGVIAAIIALLQEGAIHGVNFPTPRGVFVGRVAYASGA
jgi:predicted O-methyltransferase YrrM